MRNATIDTEKHTDREKDIEEYRWRDQMREKTWQKRKMSKNRSKCNWRNRREKSKTNYL